MDFRLRFAPAAPARTPAPLDIAARMPAAGWSALPAAVRRRFAAAHHDTTYQGALDLDCSLAGRAFALLARLAGGPLPGCRRQAVPARVRVYGDGDAGVVWERHLHMPDGAVRVVRSTKMPGPGQALIERTDGGLAMVLDVFEDEGALVFRSRRYFLALGRWQLPVPTLFTPGTCRVEHRDLGAGRFRFTLSMVHPLWGRTFHQTGVFRDPEEVS